MIADTTLFKGWFTSSENFHLSFRFPDLEKSQRRQRNPRSVYFPKAVRWEEFFPLPFTERWGQASFGNAKSFGKFKVQYKSKQFSLFGELVLFAQVWKCHQWWFSFIAFVRLRTKRYSPDYFLHLIHTTTLLVENNLECFLMPYYPLFLIVESQTWFLSSYEELFAALVIVLHTLIVSLSNPT